MDALASVPFTGVELLQVRMYFDLMGRWDHLRLLQQLLRLLSAEVGDANRLRLALFECLFHGLPCVDEMGVAVDGLAVGVFGEHVVAASESDGPVHEVEIHVVGAEVGEGSIKSGFDVVGVMCIVPLE